MNLLYIMHIDWKWIKQRPHFLAESLNKDNKVYVFSRFAFKNRKALLKNNTDLYHRYMLSFPFVGHSKLLTFLFNWMNRLRFSFFVRKKNIDYIWICSPTLLNVVPKKMMNKIIYDCMDDYLSFFPGNDNIKHFEFEVINHAAFVFASSQSLVEKIKNRYGYDKTILIRNAFNGKLQKCMKHKKNETFNIAYFGTISGWFDTNLINQILENDPYVTFHFFGPVEIELGIMNDKRIIIHGSVPHSDLYDYIKKMDCLIMPFVLNELILSVDPVKLYEYVNFEKNILCVKYPEIERFRKFVFFYSNVSECIKIIKKLESNNSLKYSKQEKEEFLSRNTWDYRADLINEVINND